MNCFEKASTLWKAALKRLRMTLGYEIELDPAPWAPGFLLYCWIEYLASRSVSFFRPAQEAAAYLFLVGQAVLLFLPIVALDGLIMKKGRAWRVAFVFFVYAFVGVLYLDALLYRMMSIHLLRGLNILLEGGLQHLAENWEHIGISTGSLHRFAEGAGLVLALTLAYSLAVVWLRSGWKKLTVGSLAAVLIIAAGSGWVLERWDHHLGWDSRFHDLEAAMPVRIGVGRRMTGLLKLEPAKLRSLRQGQDLVMALRTLHRGATNLPGIFVFVLESTRGDFVTQEITPNLKRFSADCLSFPDALSSGNTSHISWYALLTGNFAIYYGI